MMQNLIFEQHPLYVILCLAAGLAYGWFHYRRKGPWSHTTNRMLLVFRAVMVFLLCLLLLEPSIHQTINTTEDPTFTFVVDNSNSMSRLSDESLSSIKSFLSEAATDLQDRGFNVEWRAFDTDQLDSIANYTFKSSNLASLLDDVQLRNEGRNLSGVFLVSDGIYNEGISPVYKDYRFPIYTLAVGDTLAPKDVAIVNLQYNKLAYQGNKFPIEVMVQQTGYDEGTLQVRLSQEGKLLETKNLAIKSGMSTYTAQFLIDANQSGYQRYQIQVAPLDGEATVENNVQSAFVEVVDGRERIALIAGGPHPDIKALQSAITSNTNYEMEVYLLNQAKDLGKLNNAEKFDAIIYHHIANLRYINMPVVRKMLESNTSAFYIYGGQDRSNLFNSLNNLVNLRPSGNQSDQVTPVVNVDFNLFSLTDNLQQGLEEWPPLTVPFGDYEVTNATSSMLNQRVGSIPTSRPILLAAEVNGKKQAVLIGNGFWKWRLADYVANESHDQFNELVTKLIQYLSTKEDKRKFRFYPQKNSITTLQDLVFNAEVYDDLYNRVYDKKVVINLTNEAGETFSYDYVIQPGNSEYRISNLKEGVYTYSGQTTIKGQVEKVSGEIIVREQRLEQMNFVADYGMMQQLAQKTGGDFYQIENLNSALQDLKNKEAIGVVHSSERVISLINWEWLIVMLLLSVSTEWFLRKYYGGY